jgi:beta-galactosidase
MTRNILIIFFCVISVSVAFSQTTLFDADWRFHRGGAQGAEIPEFDDSKWRNVDLPHDWSIEDLPGKESPFVSTAISQVSGGFTVDGTAWYRKTFNVPAMDKSKHLVIQFDGVYMNADVYVNGKHIGNHPYGYTSFNYDITSQIKFGEKNIIAVEVKNEGQNSRWYSGSGIYRHVWLKTINPIHIEQWGTFISTPSVDKSEAVIVVKTQVQNESALSVNINLVTQFLNRSGAEVGRSDALYTINAGQRKLVDSRSVIKSPQRWSCENPALYKAVTSIYSNGKIVYSEENTFGIRTISFSVEQGFQLNGTTLKLKGGCFHNDNGPLGSKAYNRAEERKVELLKASGYNAIRCSHNPPSPAFLNACDRLGMLVIDETFDMWTIGKNPYDYHLYFKDWWQKDIESMLLRDRNHPSIIMWSIGNEIPERATKAGVETAKELVNYVKSIDSTRAVTSAVNGLNPDKDPYFKTLDIAGYNYPVGGDHLQENIFMQDHKRIPERIMYCSESYPLEAFGSWMAVEDNPFVIGDFVWTAIDYIGEASIGWLGYFQKADFYPWNLAFCGDIDICGWKRPQSFYRDALWMPNQLSLFVKPPKPSFAINPSRESWSKWHWQDAVADWNWKGNENTPMEVSAYSSCEVAELFLNGKSLGKKQTNRSTQFKAIWNVPYNAGEIKVIGYSGNEIVNTASIATAEKPLQIKLSADRENINADGQDLSYVTIELLDSKGNRNPKADNELNFSITGAGVIEAVGNANPMSLESYHLPKRKAWRGRCMVIIKSTGKSGKIILNAIGNGFKDASIQINASE